MKPNFFIVGAAKSGTTSLFEYLRQHPDIYMPSGKDISYFGGREKREDGAPSQEEYYRFFSAAKNEKRIGEASVSYLYSQEAPLRIAKEINKEARIIIILRHPVHMAYSLWGQNVRDGREKLSFEDAILKEQERMHDPNFVKQLEGSWIYNYAYIERAKYFSQVKRYIDVFGKTRVKVLIYEALFSHIKTGLKDIYDFLEIDSSFNLTSYRRYNPAGKVRSSLLHKLYSGNSQWITPFVALIPKPVRKYLLLKLYYLNTKKQALPELPNITHKKIFNMLQPDIEELEKLINIPVTKIWN